MAHRGASQGAPENTLAAFRQAVEVGADGVELDVRLTVDGVPVVLHDARVDATTDGAGLVAEMPLAQVRELDAGSWFDPAFAGEGVPTLTEALDFLAPHLVVNIEVKPAPRDAGVEEGVAKVVRHVGVEDRVWFSSFKPYALYRLRQLLPEVPSGLLYSPLTPVTRLLAPFTPHEALHPHHAMVGAGGVRWAHRRGLRVAAWTVDDVERGSRLAAWGVDAIITNDPERLLQTVGAGPNKFSGRE
jgi:glycerophosphoryl diester phosphodiesterase